MPQNNCGLVGIRFTACGKTASGEHEVSGHDFSRAINAANRVRLQPRREGPFKLHHYPRRGSDLIWILRIIVFVSLAYKLAMYGSILPRAQANVESQISDRGFENVQILQSPMDVQVIQVSSKPFYLSWGNKAYGRRTMEDSDRVGGYCPPPPSSYATGVPSAVGHRSPSSNEI